MLNTYLFQLCVMTLPIIFDKDTAFEFFQFKSRYFDTILFYI